MFQKILVANRGEIALRVICACKELGISTVAVYSEADRNALHVRFADEAVCIGPPRSSESYLNIPQVISAAEITNVDAIHPGYGFLSENANFAKVCEASEITFIGPKPEIIEMMGEKDRARREVRSAGLPTIPGSEGIVEGEEQLAKESARIGYPLILKASAGGGGRGMRVVRSQDQLLAAYQTARSEAQQAFGTPDVYAEKFLEHPRHIEFQVLGDQHGKVIHLGERECSIQRRHQKLLEESPSPFLSDDLLRARSNLTPFGHHLSPEKRSARYDAIAAEASSRKSAKLGHAFTSRSTRSPVAVAIASPPYTSRPSAEAAVKARGFFSRANEGTRLTVDEGTQYTVGVNAPGRLPLRGTRDLLWQARSTRFVGVAEANRLQPLTRRRGNGAYRDRTDDLRLAKAALSQLS